MIIKKLREYIVSERGISQEAMDAFKDTDPLFEKGILDSISAVKMLLFIEKAFGITIDMTRIKKNNFSTLSKVEKFVKESMK